MMQPAEVGGLDHRAAGRRLRRAWDGRIIVQREVGTSPVIVGQVLLKVAAPRALVPHDDVVKALAPQGADHAFHERILPRRTGRRRHVFDAHRQRSVSKVQSVERVAIPYDESRRGVPRPRLAELLRGPRRRRVRRDVHVDDAPSVVRQRHEHKQHETWRWGP
jgi:hypothetical protein